MIKIDGKRFYSFSYTQVMQATTIIANTNLAAKCTVQNS